MIDFRNIYKSYGERELLRDVSLRINPNERVGVVGPNGAGKSTLFGMITGDVEPDKGNVSLPNNMRIGYLRQHLAEEGDDITLLDYAENAVPELRGIQHRVREIEKRLGAGESDDKALAELGALQTTFESLNGYKLKNLAEAALSGLGFAVEAFDHPFAQFSGGWRMRAGLARVLIANPDIMLLDEPSNYLDAPAIEWLSRYLKSFQGTLLLISHDRYLLKALTNITIEVNCGQAVRYPGDIDFYARARESRMVELESAKRNNDRKKEQLERFIERFGAKATKASQAKSKMKALERIEDIVLPDRLAYTGRLTLPPPPRCGAEIIRVENAGFSYDKSRWIFRGVPLRVENGDKIGVVGYNGMGKTTLLKTLAGVLPLSEGTRVLGHNVVVGYQAQNFGEILPAGKSVLDVIRAVCPTGGERRVDPRGILGAFGFSGESADKPCEVLSGGEKIRLAFARIFANPPNFLVLDEPTTHLDMAARESLQQTLLAYEGSVCVVSHDIEFIRQVATTIISVGPEGVVKYHGNYDYYLDKSAAKAAAVAEGDATRAESKDLRKDRRRERAAHRDKYIKTKNLLEKRVTEVEKSLEQWEREKHNVVNALAAAISGTNFGVLNRSLKDLTAQIEAGTAEWEKLSIELETLLKEYNAVDEE